MNADYDILLLRCIYICNNYGNISRIFFSDSFFLYSLIHGTCNRFWFLAQVILPSEKKSSKWKKTGSHVLWIRLLNQCCAWIWIFHHLKWKIYFTANHLFSTLFALFEKMGVCKFKKFLIVSFLSRWMF